MNSANTIHHERLDKAINSFIQSNNVEVVDIKYSTCCCSNGNGTNWIPSAMMIY